MKKISLSQIKESQHQTVQFFRCVFDSSHIVEDALMCQICHAIQCKDCYLTKNKCFKCNSSINPDQAQLPEYLQKLINPISIKCENFNRGCHVEIDYEDYRIHTKNCQYKKKSKNQKSCSFLRKILFLFCEKKKRSNSDDNQETPEYEEKTQSFYKKKNN